MNKPVNTTEEVNRSPIGFLADSMVRGTSAAIEGQESQGQRSFVNSDTLPSQMSPQDRAGLEACGFKFIGPVEGDEVFQYVEMPAGWKKAPTDHSMWSNLVDAKGRKRAAIFYKAAFYDRSAHMSMVQRYTVRQDYERSLDAKEVIFEVRDGDAIIFSTEPKVLEFGPSAPEYYALKDAIKAEAIAWADTNFPGWNSPAAYWD